MAWAGAGTWETRRLRHVCDMRVSNVDKHTKAAETPVRLCNYVEVYKNERIRESTRFMAATASEDERVRFGLRKGDVLITKDKERLDEDQQVEFKGKAKVFCRTYDFLAAVIPHNNAAWENACTCPWDRPLSETTCEPCGASACPKGDRKHYVGPACPSCGWVRPDVLEDP